MPGRFELFKDESEPQVNDHKPPINQNERRLIQETSANYSNKLKVEFSSFSS